MNNENYTQPNIITYIMAAIFGACIGIISSGQEITSSEVISFETSTFYDINEEFKIFSGYPTDNIVKTFTVPDKVDRLLVKIWASGGGGSSTNRGGESGDYVQGEILVTPGEVLTINLGKAGDNGVPSTVGNRIGTSGVATSIYKNSELLMFAAGGAAGGATNPENSSTPGVVSGTEIVTPGLVSTTATGALAPNNTDKDYGLKAGIGGNGTNNGWSFKGSSARVVIKWGYTYPIHLLKVNASVSGIVENEHKYLLELVVSPETIFNKQCILTPTYTEGQPGVEIIKTNTWNNSDWIPKPRHISWFVFSAGDGGQPTPNAVFTIDKKLPIKITPLSWNANLAELTNIQFTVTPSSVASWENRQITDDPDISGYIVPINTGYATLTVEGNNKNGELVKRTFVVRIDAFGNTNKQFQTKIGFIPHNTYEKFTKNNNPIYIINDESYYIAAFGGLSMTGYKVSLKLTENKYNNPNPPVYDTLEYIFNVPQ